MSKLWAGRTAGDTSQIADDFNSSIRFDCRMYREDITGSMAHAAMLGAKNIIPKADADAINEVRTERAKAAELAKARALVAGAEAAEKA